MMVTFFTHTKKYQQLHYYSVFNARSVWTALAHVQRHFSMKKTDSKGKVFYVARWTYDELRSAIRRGKVWFDQWGG